MRTDFINSTPVLTISYNNALAVLDYLSQPKLNPHFDLFKNHLLLFDDMDQLLLKYKYPLAINLSERVTKSANLSNIHELSDCYYYVLLIQSGNAAVGYFKNKEVITYKVIRKYMTRAKQGKSQLSYLKTKGKSRAGSRIRLKNAVSFFEEINLKMNDYFNLYQEKIILYSCTPLLWGMLFRAKVKPPFGKKDNILKKIPLDLARPDLNSMHHVADYAMNGHMQFSEKCPEVIVSDILQIIHSPIE